MVDAYFSVYDYLVLVLVFATSVLIGLLPLLPKGYIAFKQKLKVLKILIFKENKSSLNKDGQNEIELKDVKEKEDEDKINEYLIANKKIHLIPIAFSILASIFSTNTLIGMPAEVYEYGMQITLGIIPDTIACIFSAYLFLPILGRLNVVTMTEYFQLRFNSRIVRFIGIIAYFFQMMFWNAMIIYGTGTSLSYVTGLNVYWTMTILGVIIIIYTTFGGIKGVIWADVFQLTVMISELVFIIIKGSYDAGGIEKVWKIGYEGGRINFFDFRSSPFIRQTFWSIFFGDLIATTLDYNTDQSVIQRFSATKTIKNAQYAMLITAIGSGFILFASGFVGLVIYAAYADCDPLSIPDITNLEDTNQLLAYYTTDKLKTIPGISGFIFGSLVSAAFSTVSSTLNGLVAILWKDCCKHISYFQKFDDSKSLRFAKILVIVCGAVSIVLSFMFALIGGNLIQFGYLIDGAITPPISLLFIMGSCFYFVNNIGAIVGSGVALVIGLWILIGEAVVDPEYSTLPLECNKLNISFSNISYTGEAINVSGFEKIYSISFHLYVIFVNLMFSDYL